MAQHADRGRLSQRIRQPLQQRLVTQMYFPSDPLFAYDPIFQSVPDEAARQRLVSRFSF
jgi:protocatechuate 3,4-dioxygenase beta subunit